MLETKVFDVFTAPTESMLEPRVFDVFTNSSADTDTIGHHCAPQVLTPLVPLPVLTYTPLAADFAENFLAEMLRTHVPQLTEVEISQSINDIIDNSPDSADEDDNMAGNTDLEASSGQHMGNSASYHSSAI